MGCVQNLVVPSPEEAKPLRPWLLDLFCKQGGAGMGYYRAGFNVLGVDIEPQPRYPLPFIRADALAFLRSIKAGDYRVGDEWVGLDNIAAIHASPPCQAHTKAQKLHKNEHPDLIGPTRSLLKELGLPYVIENVPGAPLMEAHELCGAMFTGLRVYRHRLFEMNWPYDPPKHPAHVAKQVKMGRKPKDDEWSQPVGNFSGVQRARDGMDIQWMNQDGLREAIPPAYTEDIGKWLLHLLKMREAA